MTFDIDILTYLALPIIAACLVKSWSDINARWLLSVILLLEILSVSTHSFFMTMPIFYYAWGAILSLVFFIFAIGRKFWSYHFRHVDFFRKAHETHFYTKQEAAIAFLFLISFFANAITFFEVYFYYIDWLDNAYFKLYVRDQIQGVVYILTCIAIISFSYRFSSSQREHSNETVK